MERLQLMKLLFYATLLLLFTCQNPGTNTKNSPMQTEKTILMKQNTVTTLEGVRIGNGNYFTRDYELPDGSTKNGLAGRLFFPDDSSIIVGVGSVFDVKEKQFEVIDIGKQYENRPYGFIRLREVE